MKSQFGDFTQELRLERGLLLGKMAEDLGMGSAELSSMENNRTRIPEEMSEKIARIYHLNVERKKELLDAIRETNQQISNKKDDSVESFIQKLFSQANNSSREEKPITFGRFLQKLRIEQDLLLGEMAEDLEMGVAELSAMENSRNYIPEEIGETIARIYHLDENRKQELEESIKYSNNQFSNNNENTDVVKNKIIYIRRK